jgi:hypothetical protein
VRLPQSAGLPRARQAPPWRPREDARLDAARHPGQAHSGALVVVNGYVDDTLCAVPGRNASRLWGGTGVPLPSLQHL